MSEDKIKVESLLILEKIKTELEKQEVKPKNVKKRVREIKVELGLEKSLVSSWRENIIKNRQKLSSGISMVVLGVIFFWQQPITEFFAMYFTASIATALTGTLFVSCEFVNLVCVVVFEGGDPEIRKQLLEEREKSKEMQAFILDNFRDDMQERRKIQTEMQKSVNEATKPVEETKTTT